MSSTEPETIKADALLEKISQNGVQTVDNAAISSALTQKPLVNFASIFGELNQNPSPIEQLKTILPETAIQATAQISENYSFKPNQNTPGLG